MVENKTEENATLETIEQSVPEQLHPILEAAFKHSKQIIIAVVAIIAVSGAYAGITAYNHNALTTAQNKLGKILIEASREDKIAKLESMLTDVPSAARPAVLLELANACMTNGAYDKAAGYWDNLSGEADGDLKLVARMGKGKCLILAGKGTEAVTELKDLAGTAPASYTIPVYRQLALAAELAGDTPTALEAYKKLADQPVSDKPFIQFKVAQLESK